jgi:hypothetical protein
MMRRALLVTALCVAGPVLAQDAGDRARLDEFALPSQQSSTTIEQLGSAVGDLEPQAIGSGDRAVTIPGPDDASQVPLPQLSAAGDLAPAAQLSNAVQSRQLAPGSVSSSADSRPRSSAPMVGLDRCDPQLDTQKREQCRRILERRAAEFDAPEAPKLSAEQVLLAERGETETMRATGSSTGRVRLATTSDPDADLRSNQELATIFLDGAGNRPPANGPAEDQPAVDPALAEVLKGLQITLPNPAAP